MPWEPAISRHRHLSYNINAGTGGIGVPDQQLMPGVSCTDCHMYRSDVDGSNSKMFGGHTWANFVPESGGSSTVSCQPCHPGSTPGSAEAIISLFQTDFQNADAAAQASVSRAAAAMQNIQNTNWTALLQEAEHNMTYAESDESGGFHNFTYLMALINDANNKALSFPILDAAVQGPNLMISWTGAGTLQSASSLNGPWQDVSGAANPLLVNRTQAQQQFYRLRQ